MSHNNVSKYIVSFISKHGSEELLSTWNEKGNEKDFKKLFKEKTKKSGPKRNKTAYMFFCDEEREKIKSEGLELNNKEILTEMAARWKKLKEESPSSLEKYNKLAESDKERYTKEVEEYVEPEGEEGPEKKKKKKKSDSDIKKNKSAYMFFCVEEREKIKSEGLELNNKEIVTEMAARWKKVKEDSPDVVARFEKLAEEDKQRYQSQKGEAAPSAETETKTKSKKTVSKKEKVEKTEKVEKVEKPKKEKVEKTEKSEKPKKEKTEKVEKTEKPKKEAKKPKKVESDGEEEEAPVVKKPAKKETKKKA